MMFNLISNPEGIATTTALASIFVLSLFVLISHRYPKPLDIKEEERG